MTTSHETFGSLWEYCSSNKRVIPHDWEGFYKRLTYKFLAYKRRNPSDDTPLPPPIPLLGWFNTIPLHKQLVFREQLEWAAEHNELDQIGAFLRALPEDGWYHIGELPVP